MLALVDRGELFLCTVIPMTTIMKTIQEILKNTLKKLKCSSKKCSSDPQEDKKRGIVETNSKQIIKCQAWAQVYQ